jgi:hypothetical protein
MGTKLWQMFMGRTERWIENSSEESGKEAKHFAE